MPDHDTPGPTRPYRPADTPPSDDGTFPTAAQALLAGLGLGDASADTSFATADEPLPTLPGFEVLAEIGCGGMGVVYKARELALNRLVAVKMIRPGSRPTPRDVLRFQAEAEAVAAVKHPNVVEVYSSGRAGDRPYFVMEYVAGGSLAARLRSGPLAPRDAAAVVAAVARGVHAAHEAGIVHRDLKPGNVLLSVPSGQWPVASAGGSGSGSALHTAHCPLPTPKVSDFGLAKRLDAGADGQTKTFAVVGTPAYMAPEQARGRGKFAGPEVDVYALGVVLYECLTGRPPFKDDDPVALLRRVTDDAPVPPRTLVAGVHPDLDLICRKCLAKEAGDRYATAADLADDLDRFGLGLPVVARPIPRVVRAARWARRNPTAAALAALAALVLTAGPAAVVWKRADDHAREQDRLAAMEQAMRAAEARVAAEKLAAARELAAVEGPLHRRGADRPTGWTWANAADLRRAATLAAGDPAALARLRTEAATALLAAGLRPAEPIARGFTAGAMAASADGKLVALGPLNVWGGDAKKDVLSKFLAVAAPPITVLVRDPASGAKVRDFAFPAARVERDGTIAPDRVTALAFSPDGRRVYAATRSKRVARLDLDAPADEPAKVWHAPAAADHLAVTADGRSLLGTCDDVVVRWDAVTGTRRDQMAAPGACGLAVEPGTGTVLAALPDGLVRAAPTPAEFPVPPATPAGRYVRHPAPLPGGRLVAAARDGHVELWDALALCPVARFADRDLPNSAAHADNVTAVAPHPSGAYLATASYNRVVKVWAVASGDRVAMVQLPGNGPAALAWSGDGRHLLATGPGATARFEFTPPPAERVAGLYPYPLAAAAPAGGGRVVALGEFIPPPAGTGREQLLFRTAPDGRVAEELPLLRWHEPTWPGLAVRPATGEVFVTSRGTGLKRWQPGAGGLGADLGTDVCRCPAVGPDGTAWAVAASKRVRAWDTAGNLIPPGWANDAGEAISGTGSLNALAVGPGVAAAGGEDGGVHVLGPGGAHVRTFPAGLDPVQAVAVAADGSAAAAGTRAGTLRLFRLGEMAELPAVADAHPGGATAAAFAPDGSLLVTGGKDRAVRFWARAPAGGYEPVAAVTGLPAPVRSLAFERDRPVLVVLLAGERAARVWDADRLRAQLTELGLGW